MKRERSRSQSPPPQMPQLEIQPITSSSSPALPDSASLLSRSNIKSEGYGQKDPSKSGPTLQCDLCFDHVPLAEFSVHTQGHVDRAENNKCVECGKTFKYASSLAVHVRQHTGERPYECSTCGQRYMHSHTLKSHRRKHTGEHPFMCGICHKSFGYKGSLVRHLKLHLSCRVCNINFESQEEVDRHNQLTHSNLEHKCEICDHRFRYAMQLSAHMRIHSGSPFQCRKCKETFPDRKAMSAHSLRQCTPPLSLGILPKLQYSENMCHVCHKAFDTKNELLQHIESHGPPPAPIVASIVTNLPNPLIGSAVKSEIPSSSSPGTFGVFPSLSSLLQPIKPARISPPNYLLPVPSPPLDSPSHPLLAPSIPFVSALAP
eukprot:798695_1